VRKERKLLSLSEKLNAEVEDLLKSYAQELKWEYDIEDVPDLVRLLIRQGWNPLVKKLEEVKKEHVDS
jgi:hypothetical protein